MKIGQQHKNVARLAAELAGGKSMTLPAASAVGLGRSGKAPGVFSSLQQKKAAKEHRRNGGNGMPGRKR